MKTKWVILFLPILFACTEKKELESASKSFEGGTWTSNCVSSGSTYEVRTAGFSGGQFSQGSTYYSGYGCTGALIKMDFAGTYALGGALGGTAMQMIDLTLVSITLTPLSSAVVTSYNSQSLCGFSNWAVGVGKVITGMSCGGSTMPAAGAVDYNLYYIQTVSIPSQGMVEGTLNFGFNDASHDGTTSAKRPDSVDGAFGYTKP